MLSFAIRIQILAAIWLAFIYSNKNVQIAT